MPFGVGSSSFPCLPTQDVLEIEMKHGNATLDEIRPIVPKSNNGGIDSRAVDAQPKNSNQFQVLKQVCQNFDLWV